jgi:hypothetical protein
VRGLYILKGIHSTACCKQHEEPWAIRPLNHGHNPHFVRQNRIAGKWSLPLRTTLSSLELLRTGIGAGSHNDQRMAPTRPSTYTPGELCDKLTVYPYKCSADTSIR